MHPDNSRISIVKTFDQPHTFKHVLPQDRDLIAKVLLSNLGLKSSEKVIIVSDSPSLESGQVWFEAARSLGANPTMIVISGMDHSGQQPPEEVLAYCRQAQVLILQTKYSLTHTLASQVAREHGARVASLPGANLELLRRTLDMSYRDVKDLGTQLCQRLEKSREIKITSPFGTNLVAQVRQKNIIDDNGFILPGEVGNLPAGEVFFAPVDDSTQGTWVINGSLSSEDHCSQIIVEIVDGKAIKIDGGTSAKNLEKKLAQVGPDAFVVAELGIGTNQKADPFGPVIEAEKAYGTAHLALGNNFHFGGDNDVPIHLDGVTLEPTIMLDEQIILNRGKFNL